MTLDMIPEIIGALFAVVVALLVTLDGIAYLYTTFVDIVFTSVQDHSNPTKGDE